jgi:hypothetical protein
MKKTLTQILDEARTPMVKRPKGDIFAEILAFLDEYKTAFGEEIANLAREVQYLRDNVSQFKGDKGDKGDSIIGPQGDKPIPGVDFPIPKDGKPGKNGRDGKDSTIPGPKGDPGKDGSPDTPKEIVLKLNSLENVLDMGVIKGLLGELEKMRKIRTEIRREGGGMGNVQHESFNVSSATTTITLAYPIGGNGFSIFGFYYQGQEIFRGRGYTVGTGRRILTLSFTPEDDTVIDIVYIRG